MDIFLRGNAFGYEMRNVAALFFARPAVKERPPTAAERGGEFIYLSRALRKGRYKLLCAVSYNGCRAAARAELEQQKGDRECERVFGILLFGLLCDLTGLRPVWGVSTGVRPAKFAAAMLKAGSPDGVAERLWRDYLVQKDKAELCVQAALKSRAAAALSRPNSYSLYVSVPFCPTRCSYCSFVSKETGREGGLIEPYLEKLRLELIETAKTAGALGLRLETVYIGGGTPSVLSAGQIGRLLGDIGEYFDIANVREYCFEAGRPDTISAQKLAAIKAGGVTRLSINPQTKHQAILDAIGRRHTPGDVERAFALAQDAGFRDINADVIAGLPGDSVSGFAETLGWLLDLGPSGVTVHALTLKRASFMRERGAAGGAGGALEMTRLAARALAQAGLEPYYMYKQKSTVESLENTGYARPGREGLYNIFMMDEVHTVLACGAGAVIKLKQPNGERIERIFNYKYPAEYIGGFNALLERKRGIEEFYNGVI